MIVKTTPTVLHSVSITVHVNDTATTVAFISEDKLKRLLTDPGTLGEAVREALRRAAQPK